MHLIGHDEVFDQQYMPVALAYFVVFAFRHEIIIRKAHIETVLIFEDGIACLFVVFFEVIALFMTVVLACGTGTYE